MRRPAIVALLVTLGVVLTACASGPSITPTAARGHAAQAVTTKLDPVELRQEFRKLWEDHTIWTRMFIVSAAAGLPDQNVTAERLLRNQDAIGNAMKPFYGDAVGGELTNLLHEHILVAADLLIAAKAGDAAKVEQSQKAWYSNADEIAAFLAAANPENWSLDHMRAHMRSHLDLTLEEAVARLQGRFLDDVAAYDKVRDQILGMADALASGIVAQFPEKFAP